MLGRRIAPQTFTIVYYLLLSALLVGRTSSGIADARMRRILTSAAGMIVLFVLFRGMKYHAFQGMDQVERILWYLYYLPILFLPTLSLWAALALDVKDRKSYVFGCSWTGLLSGALLLCVLTNDFHQKVFRFLPDFQNWDSDYSHGVAYYVVAAWTLLTFIGSIAVMTKKCRVSSSKFLFWIPLIPVLIGIVYTVLYGLGLAIKYQGINVIEVPEVACFVMACFWESLIQIGLIPSNKGYDELLRHSSLAVQIADAGKNVIYASETAGRLLPEQMDSEEPVWLDQDVALHRASIRGGYIFWKSNVAKLNQINRELEELEERLSEETELIRLQNDMSKKRAEIEEKNRVYDSIAEQVLPQSRKIAELVRMTEEDGTLFQKNVAKISVLGTYVKRHANLVLLAENAPVMSVKELSLAIAESFHAISAAGIPTALSCQGEKEIASAVVIETYAFVEKLVEAVSDALKGISVILTEKECKVSIETEQRGKGSLTGLADHEANVPVNCFWEDETFYARISFTEGGERR